MASLPRKTPSSPIIRASSSRAFAFSSSERSMLLTHSSPSEAALSLTENTSSTERFWA